MDNGSNKIKKLTINILTLNAAGGKPSSERKPEILGKFIEKKKIDFIFLQELAELSFDGGCDSVLDDILLKVDRGKYKGFFSPTVSTRIHPCPKKVEGTNRDGKWYSTRFMPENTFVETAKQGNGFIINGDRWEIIDIWKGERSPTLASVTISQPSLFLGDRETEPRCLVLIRVKLKKGPDNFEMFLGCTHLTVLRGEVASEKAELDSKIRKMQVEAIMQIVGQLSPTIPIVMAGDFNAELRSPELSQLSSRFLAVTDFCSSEDKQLGTHKGRGTFIDHILCYPDKSFTVKECRIVVKELEAVSDHRPIYAELDYF